MKRIVLLISGRGSNMEAIVQRCAAEGWPAQVVAVISNRPQAKGLDFARAHGIATAVVDHKQYPMRSDFDAALAAAIDAHEPDVVALAGFMRVLGADFVEHYAGRLLNIHPSLLPAFPGLHTHRAAIEAGCKLAGATVHLSDRVSLAAVYRGEFSLELDLDATLKGDLSGLTSAYYALESYSINAFLPRQVVAGSSFVITPDLRANFDLTWVNFSAYRSPVADVKVALDIPPPPSGWRSNAVAAGHPQRCPDFVSFSPTITPSSGRACARSSKSGPTGKWSPRRGTAVKPSSSPNSTSPTSPSSTSRCRC